MIGKENKQVEKLKQVLKKQLTNLAALAKVMADEQQLLCAGRIQGALLQKVTGKKSSLLEILAKLDQQRLDEESALGLTVPYPNASPLHIIWQKIQQSIVSLDRINRDNGMLLDRHISHNTRALEILSARHQISLYGPDGQACKLNPMR